MQKSFWQAGHKPTLFSAFLYFDLSFMVWVLLGPLAVQIATDLQLSPAEKGLMVAVPILFVHSWLQTKTIELITSLETAAGKYMTLVADRQSARTATRLELAKVANG